MARDTIESIGLFGLQVDTTTGEYAIVEYNGSGELVTDGVDLSITRAGVGAITETTYTDNVSYNFQATQVAADDTPDATGYKVLFQDSFSGRMIVWTVDDTGAYVSQQEITNDPAAIRDAEVLFDVDGLDDVDGIGAEVGPTVVVVDDNATGVDLITTDGAYGIVDAANSIDLDLTREGVGTITETTYTDNVSYNFQATQVAADDTPDATGYKVLFQDSFSGRMIVWTVDDTGAYVSQQEITNDPAAIRDAEVLFNVDGLDDVPGIGAEVTPPDPTVVVVDDNATGVDLITTDGAYGIVDAANSIDLDLTREGVGTITETTYTDNVSYNFQATQVAADDTPDATGYKVLFQDSFSGRMIVWTVDDTGAYVSQQEITNDPAAIRDAEVLFNVDGLDDVPGIGAEVTPPDPTVVVVDDNATGVDLITTDGAYGIVDAANSIDLDLTREGVGTITDATYTDNVSYNFQATQVAADDTPDATGYKVLFQDSFTGRMIVWTVDDTGAYVSQQEITNDPAAIRDAEVLFNVDGLDDVPGIGAEVGPTVVVVDDNATGVDLITTDGAYGIVDAANSIDLDLTREGVGTITETTYTDNVSYNFQATQVAADDTPDATGYKVLFQDSFTGRMIVWTVDDTGAYVSQQEITNDPAAIRDAEVLFNVDGLDDVPGIGAEVGPTVVVVDDNATGVDLITTDGAYGIVDAANSIDLDLTREGVGTITDATYTDNVSYNFQATQVAADDTPDATGYKVLFQDSFTGRMIVWTVDDTGAYVSQQEITNDPAAIRDAEVLFNVDGLDDVPGIGAEVGPTVVVVDDNATGVDLITTDGAYGIVDAANSIDLDLTREGVGTITETTYTDNVSYNFQATQVAADDTPDATGYKVLFQDSFSGRMIVWTVDETGAYVSQQEITNDPAAIRDAEVLFDSDVDSDNFQFLENNGAVGLKIDTQTDQYVVETESNEIALTDTGDALIFSESGPIEAEIDDFQVLQLLFEVEAGYETVSVDLLSGAVDQLSATAISELDAESLFDVDLNGDGTIGVIA